MVQCLVEVDKVAVYFVLVFFQRISHFYRFWSKRRFLCVTVIFIYQYSYVNSELSMYISSEVRTLVFEV